MKLKFEQFNGVAPIVSPRKLGLSAAQVAQNVNLEASTIRRLRSPLDVLADLDEASGISSIYRFGLDLVSDTQYWFRWIDEQVDVIKAQINGDETERTMMLVPSQGLLYTNNSLALTDGSGPYPWNTRPLGVPAPTDKPAGTASGGDTDQLPADWIYLITHVTDLGEESAQGPVSDAITVYPGGTVSLTNLGSSTPLPHVTAKRIYRTLNGNQTTDFHLVDEIPAVQDVYSDSLPDETLARTDLLKVAGWAEPPADPVALFNMSNGITVVATKYDLWPSVAYVPYAYPVSNAVSCPYPVVGGAGAGNAAVILTMGPPCLLIGTDPTAMSLQELNFPQACVSKRSIAAVPDGVMYASPDGLCYVSASGATRNLTEKLMGIEDWRALNPASIHGYFHDGRYFGFYDNGDTQAGFIFDVDPDGPGQMPLAFIDVYALGGYVDLLQDALYLDMGDKIVRWNAGDDFLEAIWKSGIAVTPKPINFSCAEAVSSHYPVRVLYYADGELKHTQEVESAKPFRLPRGFIAREHEIQIEIDPDEEETDIEVVSVSIAQSMAELSV